MQRIDHSTASADLFGAGKDGYTEGDIGLGIPPTVVTADWLNSIQEEIANAVEGAGITLALGTRTQLLSAILALSGSRNRIDGFTLSNGTDATNDINIAAGIASNSANTGVIGHAATFVKQIDAAWAAGSAAGGFPSGGGLLTLTNSTWYRVFVIGKSTDASAFDAGFDTSATAANLLHASNAGGSGFDTYRQVGWIRRGSSTNVAFSQVGDRFYWDVASKDANGVTPNASGTALTVLAPPGSIAIMDVWLAQTGNCYLKLNQTAQTNTAASASNYTVQSNSGSYAGSTTKEIPVDSSSQIRQRGSAAASTFDLFTVGWIDIRGKQ